MPRKKKKWADLHIHSIGSDDGELPAVEIVKRAFKNRRSPLKMLAITDHEEFDVANLTGAMAYAKKNHIELITGLEVSTDDKECGFDKVHILGYFPRCRPEELGSSLMQEIIVKMQEDKRIRNDKYLRIFRSYDMLSQEEVDSQDYGRSKATLVQKLFDIWKRKEFVEFRHEDNSNKVYVRNIEQVWNLVEDRRFRQQRDKISTESMIYHASRIMGGKCVFAHPLLQVFKNTRESILERALKELPSKNGEYETFNTLKIMFDKYREKYPEIAIETYYPYAKTRVYRSLYESNPESRRVMRKLQKRLKQYCLANGINMSGGSDFHGKMKPKIEIGDQKIPYDLAFQLMNS